MIGLADGGFAVAWQRKVGSATQMHYAVYNVDGSVRKAPTLLDDFGTVNQDASLVALDNGGFAIAYEDNGWVTGHTDITLARLDAGGNFVGWIGAVNDPVLDRAPVATLLSNGMIVLGTVRQTVAGTRAEWASSIPPPARPSSRLLSTPSGPTNSPPRWPA